MIVKMSFIRCVYYLMKQFILIVLSDDIPKWFSNGSYAQLHITYYTITIL